MLDDWSSAIHRKITLNLTVIFMIAFGRHPQQINHSPKFLSNIFQLPTGTPHNLNFSPLPLHLSFSWRWSTNTFRATWNDGYRFRFCNFLGVGFFVQQKSVGKYFVSAVFCSHLRPIFFGGGNSRRVQPLFKGKVMQNNLDFERVCVCVYLNSLHAHLQSTLATKSVECAHTVSTENIGQSNS